MRENPACGKTQDGCRYNQPVLSGYRTTGYRGQFAAGGSPGEFRRPTPRQPFGLSDRDIRAENAVEHPVGLDFHRNFA